MFASSFILSCMYVLHLLPFYEAKCSNMAVFLADQDPKVSSSEDIKILPFGNLPMKTLFYFIAIPQNTPTCMEEGGLTISKQEKWFFYFSLKLFFSNMRETPLGFCLMVIVNQFHPNLEKTTSSVLSVILINLWSLYFRFIRSDGHVLRHLGVFHVKIFTQQLNCKIVFLISLL